MRRPAGTPDRLETEQRLVDDGTDREVVSQGRDAADREAGRLPHLVAAGLAHVLAELGHVHAPVACAETEQRPIAVDEDERLDDLAHLGADGIRGLLGGTRRVRKLAHLGLETELGQAVLDSLCGRMEHWS